MLDALLTSLTLIPQSGFSHPALTPFLLLAPPDRLATHYTRFSTLTAGYSSVVYCTFIFFKFFDTFRKYILRGVFQITLTCDGRMNLRLAISYKDIHKDFHAA
jgi:hypothetical protein